MTGGISSRRLLIGLNSHESLLYCPLANPAASRNRSELWDYWLLKSRKFTNRQPGKRDHIDPADVSHRREGSSRVVNSNTSAHVSIRQRSFLMTKKALCVGINNYPFGDENDLKGCLNDANDWAALLKLISTSLTLNNSLTQTPRKQT